MLERLIGEPASKPQSSGPQLARGHVRNDARLLVDLVGFEPTTSSMPFKKYESLTDILTRNKRLSKLRFGRQWTPRRQFQRSGLHADSRIRSKNRRAAWFTRACRGKSPKMGGVENLKSRSARTMTAHQNPLRPVWDDCRQLMKIAWSAAAQQALPPSKREALVRNDEERNHCQDVVARVGVLADAYDKLCRLNLERFEIDQAMKENQSGSGIDLSRVSPSALQRDRNWRSEVDAASSLFYYELKSVLDMLKGWRVAASRPELEYASKTRNWFLAHPQYLGVARRAARSFSYSPDGGPVELSVTGLNVWLTITRQYYIAELNLTQPIDENAQRVLNEQLALSGKFNHRLTRDEILRLKAFGLREPRIRDCAAELSQVLRQEVLPKIEAAFAESLQYGFVPTR
jgi:hypothetical protein